MALWISSKAFVSCMRIFPCELESFLSNKLIYVWRVPHYSNSLAHVTLTPQAITCVALKTSKECAETAQFRLCKHCLNWTCPTCEVFSQVPRVFLYGVTVLVYWSFRKCESWLKANCQPQAKHISKFAMEWRRSVVLLIVCYPLGLVNWRTNKKPYYRFWVARTPMFHCLVGQRYSGLYHFCLIEF